MISRILKIAALFFVFIFIVAGSAYLTLTLIIKSEDTVVVPDLIGKDVIYVLELLTDLGLNTKVEGSEYSANVPKNNVIFQDPEPGSEIKKERDVRIVISKGPKFILMPNLEGLSVQQAQIILEENSLCLGEISSTYKNIIKKETIIASCWYLKCRFMFQLKPNLSLSLLPVGNLIVNGRESPTPTVLHSQL